MKTTNGPNVFRVNDHLRYIVCRRLSDAPDWYGVWRDPSTGEEGGCLFTGTQEECREYAQARAETAALLAADRTYEDAQLGAEEV